ncbi:uncharacterized protein LOC143215137 isoform X1 [Lasioglossum baleicum]|uniref:uncharacterized protein LOC143215137 isoform X1 n=1 Tax=Lasioglossum baleicum TaxID=434251 RepID=UPI003FCE8663
MAAVLDPCQNYSRNSGVVVTRAAATIELVELVFGIDPCRRGSAIHSRRRIQKGGSSCWKRAERRHWMIGLEISEIAENKTVKTAEHMTASLDTRKLVTRGPINH